MSINTAIAYLVLWSLIGAIVFSAFVIFVFRTGIVSTSRKDDGLLKEKIPLRGYLTSIGFLLAIVGFLVLANYLGLVRRGFILEFGMLFTLNLLLFLILFLYDTLVIDGFVLGYWRPDFLYLPDAMGWDSMKEHMFKSIPAGIIFGLILSLLSSIITFYAFMR
jgi:hypothetical protein